MSADHVQDSSAALVWLVLSPGGPIQMEGGSRHQELHFRRGLIVVLHRLALRSYPPSWLPAVERLILHAPYRPTLMPFCRNGLIARPAVGR